MAYKTTHKELTPETEADLGLRAQNGDIQARNKLLLNNLPLVHKISQSFDLTPDMAESLGTAALLRAIQYFNPKRGRFAAIATLCIRHEFINHKTKEHRHSTLTSLDVPNPIFEDEEEPLVEQISDNQPAPVDIVHKTSLLNSVPKLLSILTDQERRMICEYFGLNGEERCSYQTIAEREKLSRESVRLYMMGALKKMRKKVTS